MNTEEKVIDMMKRPTPKRKVGIVRLQMIREGAVLYEANRFNSPKEAVEMVWPLVRRAGREMMIVMSVDTKMLPLAIEIVAVGGLNACYVDMRDLFKHAILNNAAHKHPSGDTQISQEDRKITNKIRQAGDLLGIPLHDHIIIGDQGSYRSMREEGGFDPDDHRGEAA